MSDTFILKCPKCESNALEKISASSSSFLGKKDLVLGCRRCGKRLYGYDTVEQEYNKQKAEWEGRKLESSKPSPAPVVWVPKPKPKKVNYEATLNLPPCAWEECNKPSRKRSKYCSRYCSNKNARHRHALRKETAA